MAFLMANLLGTSTSDYIAQGMSPRRKEMTQSSDEHFRRAQEIERFSAQNSGHARRQQKSVSGTWVARLASPADWGACCELREQWLVKFNQAHAPADCWCPAGVPVPRLENEQMIREHFSCEGEAWAAVLADGSEVLAYLLCRSDSGKSELKIEHHGPRVRGQANVEAAASRLFSFVMPHAAEQGLRKTSIFWHGFPDEIRPLAALYSCLGFDGKLRLEMIGRQFQLDAGAHTTTFRSAEEIGPEEFHRAEVSVGEWPSVEEAQANGEFSQRMWPAIQPAQDWFAAYEEGRLVGIVRTAVTRNGVGVLDGICLGQEYRGRGLGRSLLAHALRCLSGRTELVWLDVDEDNTPARRLYQWAGFRVHHVQGAMVREGASAMSSSGPSGRVAE